VVGESGSGIGSNLNRTELSAEFRLKVQSIAELNLRVRFDVRAERPAFECRT
jgi:hypothetical protein